MDEIFKPIPRTDHVASRIKNRSTGQNGRRIAPKSIDAGFGSREKSATSKTIEIVPAPRRRFMGSPCSLSHPQKNVAINIISSALSILFWVAGPKSSLTISPH
jgi:hypothetical protein